jgi:hypothetical protein
MSSHLEQIFIRLCCKNDSPVPFSVWMILVLPFIKRCIFLVQSQIKNIGELNPVVDFINILKQIFSQFQEQTFTIIIEKLTM